MFTGTQTQLSFILGSHSNPPFFSFEQFLAYMYRVGGISHPHFSLTPNSFPLWPFSSQQSPSFFVAFFVRCIFIIFDYVCVNMSVCRIMYMSVGTLRGQSHQIPSGGVIGGCWMRWGCERVYCKYKGENNQSHLKVSRLNWAVGRRGRGERWERESLGRSGERWKGGEQEDQESKQGKDSPTW